MNLLSKDLTDLLHSRIDELRTAINVLLTCRARVDQQRTTNRNGLVRVIDLGLDTRRHLIDPQITEMQGWRTFSTDTVEQTYARDEAVLLATAIY